MNILRIITFGTFFKLVASSLPEGSLRRDDKNKEREGSTPLNVNDVVTNIASYLWQEAPEFSEKEPSPFVIFGSYPAAVLAHEHDNDFTIPYNDIDVFVVSPFEEHRSREKSCKPTVVDGVIPGSSVPVHLVLVSDTLDMDSLISKNIGDINAVQAGFLVTPTFDEDGGLALYVETYSSEKFNQFLLHKTLTIDNSYELFCEPTGSGLKAEAFIRLMHKAQQLGLGYKLPDEGALMEMHGQVLKEKHFRKMKALTGARKNEIDTRFDTVSIDDSSQHSRHMLVGKGMEAPIHPEKRGLDSDSYSYDSYSYDSYSYDSYSYDSYSYDSYSYDGGGRRRPIRPIRPTRPIQVVVKPNNP